MLSRRAGCFRVCRGTGRGQSSGSAAPAPSCGGLLAGRGRLEAAPCTGPAGVPDTHSVERQAPGQPGTAALAAPLTGAPSLPRPPPSPLPPVEQGPARRQRRLGAPPACCRPRTCRPAPSVPATPPGFAHAHTGLAAPTAPRLGRRSPPTRHGAPRPAPPTLLRPPQQPQRFVSSCTSMCLISGCKEQMASREHRGPGQWAAAPEPPSTHQAPQCPQSIGGQEKPAAFPILPQVAWELQDPWCQHPTAEGAITSPAPSFAERQQANRGLIISKPTRQEQALNRL